MVTGLAGVLLAIAAAIGPNGHLVEAQLADAGGLPVDVLRRPAGGWWVVFHHQRDWAPAFYSEPDADIAVLGAAAAASGTPIHRLLPGLGLPRLFLYAPHYLEGGRLRRLEAMAVDVAEGYFHALLEAALNAPEARGDSGILDFRRAAGRRADELMAEVPAGQRLDAYLSAVRDFASHLLSIANEVRRADRRSRERGSDLCAFLDPPRTLFALWERSLRETVYRGRYRATPETGTAGNPAWRTTRRGLEAVDKARVLTELLGGRWRGDAARDFPGLCPLDSRPVRL